MTSEKRLKAGFWLGVALEFVGIVALAAKFGADLSGIAVLVLGCAALAAGAALQVWALVMSRWSEADERSNIGA